MVWKKKLGELSQHKYRTLNALRWDTVPGTPTWWGEGGGGAAPVHGLPSTERECPGVDRLHYFRVTACKQWSPKAQRPNCRNSFSLCQSHFTPMHFVSKVLIS